MPEKDDDKVKIGIIGVGHMGHYHINVLVELPEAEVVGIADIDEVRRKEIAHRYNVKAFDDFKDLIKEAEAVVIATPTATHYEIARKCLQEGVHTLIEKPITTDYEQAVELFEIAKKNKLVLMTGHVERYNGAVQELHNIVEEPYLIEARRLGPYNPRIKDVGVVLDLMIHDLDIVLGLVDSPIKQIAASGKKVVSAFEDVATAQITFEDGSIAILTASRLTEHKIRTLAITQKNAYIFLDYSEQDIRIYRSAASKYYVSREEIRYSQEVFIEQLFVHKDNALKLELRDFITRIKNGKIVLDYEKELKALRTALNIINLIGEG